MTGPDEVTIDPDNEVPADLRGEVADSIWTGRRVHDTFAAGEPAHKWVIAGCEVPEAAYRRHIEMGERMEQSVRLLREAIRLTREYVGESVLPALPGWAWFDVVGQTGGYEGFGGCGAVLDPALWGRTSGAAGGLRYCNLPAGHAGDHGRRPC